MAESSSDSIAGAPQRIRAKVEGFTRQQYKKAIL